MATHRSEAKALWRIHGAVLLAYTLGALLLTWPLARHFATHVPGDGIDDPALAWNLWWIKARLVDQLQPDIFRMGWMFHPIQINLAFFTLTPLNGLLSLPLQLAFGLVPAVNLLVIASFVLGGYGMYLLARAVLAPIAATATVMGAVGNVGNARALHVHGAAFAAGFLYAFAAPKLFYVALGQFNIASSQWLPFCALYVLLLLRARTVPHGLRAGALAALFLVLQAWAELTFASFLLLFVALAAAAALVLIVRERRRLWSLAGGFALMGLLFVLGMLPYLAAMAPDLLREGDFFGSGGGFANLYSADLAGFLLPTRLHPWAGDRVATLPFPNDKGQHIFLGYIAPLLAAVGFVWLWKRARWQALFWGAATAAFWALSLGPALRWMGRDLPIPGPFALVSLLPFFNGNRYPSRYGVPLLMCVGVLMAAGLVALLQQRVTVRRRHGALITMAVVALITLESLSVPLPLSNFHIPEIYQTLAREPGNGALLELPTGWRNGARVLGRSDILIMMQQWRQTAHGKPRLGGNTSRNPPQKFQYFTEHPLIGDLIALMNSDQPGLESMAENVDLLIARHTPIAAQELADLGITWVTLHEEKATPPLIRFVEEALPLDLVEVRTEPDWSGAPETIRLYRVQPTNAFLPRTYTLAGAEAAEGAFAFLGEGWSSARTTETRYANSSRATLLLPLPAQGGVITLAPALPAAPQLFANGVRLPPAAADASGNAYTLPAGVATVPVSTLEMRFSGGGVPVPSLATAPSAVGTTGATLPPGVVLFARSAGEPTGNFAHLWVQGVDVAPGTRGFNLAALSPEGALLEAAVFDTFASEEESARMAAWLRAWPPGTLIMGAVADEGSYHLTSDAISALGTVGLAAEGIGHFRRSHAFIGVTGATPGSALSDQSDIRAAAIWLGAPIDGARAYGPVNALSVR